LIWFSYVVCHSFPVFAYIHSHTLLHYWFPLTNFKHHSTWLATLSFIITFSLQGILASSFTCRFFKISYLIIACLNHWLFETRECAKHFKLLTDQGKLTNRGLRACVSSCEFWSWSTLRWSTRFVAPLFMLDLQPDIFWKAYRSHMIAYDIDIFTLPGRLIIMGFSSCCDHWILVSTQSSIFNDCTVPLCFSAEDIYILHEDVKSCQYEDVHVLWSILVDSQTPPLTSKQWAMGVIAFPSNQSIRDNFCKVSKKL
jgi:hypothetical protein